MKFLSDILAKAGLTVDGVVTLNNTATGQTPAANDNSTKLATTAWVRGFVTPYSLPIASSVTLGGVKIGSGLAIDGTGIVSVTTSGVGAIRALQQITATAGQSVFTVSGGYTPGLIDVFLNGVLLTPTAITSTNGTTFTLGDGALVNDLLDIFVYNPIYNGFISTTDQVPEGATNLYYTNARARAAISLTTTGTSGAATYDNTTGVINIPQYQGGVTSFNTRTGAITLSSLDVTTALTYTPVTNARTLTINGTTYDLSADRSWSIASGVTSFNTRTGAISLTSSDVTTALGYTPVTNARTLTINGTAYDLTADREWTVGASSSARTIQTYTATASQTTFTVTGGYVVGLVDVFINGVRLTSADFTATNGTTVVLGTGTSVGNIVDVVKYNTAFTATNALRQVSYFTATAGQTTFTVDYTPGLVDVFYNGSKLSSSEYTASNGTSIVLTTAAVLNDAIEVVAYSYAVGAYSGQSQLNGTGLVRMSGTTVSYDNATYATESYVTTAVANLVNSAPSTLDTLNELATALGNDANFATTVTTSIGTKQPQLNGTGFVKISGTTISYDNSTYLTTASASSTYQTILTNPVTGTGTTNYLPKFTGTSTIGNSIVNDNGTGIGIGIAAASPFILNTLSTDATTNSIIGIMQIGRASSGTAANGIGGNLQFTAQDTAGTQRTAAYITWKLAAASSASPQGYLAIGTRNASEALRIDDSGNLGLGVTPSAWYTYSKVLQLGGGASIEGRSNIYDYSSINTNSYADVSGTSLYMNNGYASRYYQYLGSHNWLTAPSGTAGNAISFTQAMTLNASGNLSVGNTNDSYKLDVSGTAAVSSLIVGGASTLTGRVQGTEIGVTRDGADTIGDGPWFRWTNAATTRQMLTQLNASNGLTTWAYNGSTWSSIYTITQAGAATFSSTVKATQFQLSAASGQYYYFDNASGNNFLGLTATNTLGLYVGGNLSLSVASTGAATFTTTENQGGVYITSATDNTTLRVASTATGGQEWRLQSTGGTSGLGQGKLIFKVGGTETASYIPLTLTTDNSTNGGRLGINNNNPDANLVIGNLNTYGKGTINGASGTINRAIINCPYPGASALTLGYYSAGYGLDIWVNGDGTGLAPVYIDQRNAEAIIFRRNTQGTAAESMRITGSGSVGIGTASPTNSTLEVRGNPDNISWGSVATLYGYLTRGDAASFGENVAIIKTPASTGIVFQPAGTEKMRITSGGNVGIGTTSPAYKLDVNGQIYNQGNSSTSFIIARDYSSGSITLQQFTQNGVGTIGSISFNGTNVLYNSTSDYRLKQDLKDYNALNIISSIKTYDFEWKSNKTRSYGVIAHELAEIMPSIVSGDKDGIDDDGNILPQGLDYSKLVPIMIKAIQELKAEIDLLK